jgi:hypothetical protein
MESAHQDYLRGAWDIAVQQSQATYLEAREAMIHDLVERGMHRSGQRWLRAAALHARSIEHAIRACFEQLDRLAEALTAPQLADFWPAVRKSLPDVVTGLLRSHADALVEQARAMGVASGSLEIAMQAQLGQVSSNLRKLVADSVQMRVVLSEARAQPQLQGPTRARSSGSAPAKVFISSTFLDNTLRRKVVEDVVIRAEMVPIGMERFTASPRPAVSECMRLVAECDIYVGILAHRYGWIPDGYDRSITELEYDAARRAGKPCYVFVVDESVPVSLRDELDQGDDRWVKQAKLQAFKQKCANDLMPAPFIEANLGVLVLQALHDADSARTAASIDD